MILWIFIWIILSIPIIFIPIISFVNYVYRPSPKWFIWIFCICAFIVALSCVIVFSERNVCKDFLIEYHNAETLISQIQKASDLQATEKTIQGKITQINIKLFYYQNRSKAFGILNPYQYELRKLEPLKLKYYDTIVDPYI